MGQDLKHNIDTKDYEYDFMKILLVVMLFIVDNVSLLTSVTEDLL